MFRIKVLIVLSLPVLFCFVLLPSSLLLLTSCFLPASYPLLILFVYIVCISLSSASHSPFSLTAALFLMFQSVLLLPCLILSCLIHELAANETNFVTKFLLPPESCLWVVTATWSCVKPWSFPSKYNWFKKGSFVIDLCAHKPPYRSKPLLSFQVLSDNLLAVLQQCQHGISHCQKRNK